MGKPASLVAAKGKTFFATALAILALPLATQAANSTWGGSTGNWDVPGNWNNGIPTTAVATVNGGTAIVPTGYTGTATSLYISGSSGASGSVLISGGSMRVNSLMSVGSVAGSSGSLRITDGTLSSGLTGLNIGDSGTGSLTIEGGVIAASSGTLVAGNNASGSGTITMSGGSGTTYILAVGANGKGTFLLNGGLMRNTIGYIGRYSGSSSAMVSSGTWSAATLFVGLSGTGALSVNGGSVGTTSLSVGNNLGGTGLMAISGGSVTGTSGLAVGNLGTGTVMLSGGLLTSGTAMVSSGTGGRGTITVGSGTWVNSGSLTVGNLGSGTLTVQNGGRVTTGQTFVGTGISTSAVFGGSNALLVTGSNSRFEDADSLTIGTYGSDNTVTVEDGALLMVGDADGETITFNAGTGTGNFLRIDQGYIALFGDQSDNIDSWITAGNLKVWDTDTSTWVTATLATIEFTYYATSSAALADTGYDGLGGYTIIGAVPEPGTCALLAIGGALGLAAWRRRKSLEK